MAEFIRNEKDFLYPEPSVLSKVLHTFIAPAAPVYLEGFDESIWQYVNGKKIDHKAALNDNHHFTIIRVSNGLAKDVAFETAWESALDDGMTEIMIYANILGNKSGKDQANFAIDSAKNFIDAYLDIGKVVIWGDFEKDGLTVPVSTRQSIAVDFLNTIHQDYDTGIYSNKAYWEGLYGNLKPPSFAWLWGAHWINAAMGSFPTSWDLIRLVVWQYAVWAKYFWARAVAGNKPDIDKDKWVWKGGTPKDFLKAGQPPQPVPPHTHPDLESAIATLQQGYTTLGNEFQSLSYRIAALEKSTGQSLPYAVVHVNGTVPARFTKSYNASGKPIFSIYPSDTSPVSDRIMLSGKYNIFPSPFIGDGAEKCYAIMNHLADVTLYIRDEDGIIDAT